MNRIARTIGCLLGVVCFFSGASALAQTVTCPTTLNVAGPGFKTTNSIGPGGADVRISGNEMVCVYSLGTEWSVKAASGNACASIKIGLTASLPSPYTPAPPGGFSPWQFNGNISQLNFYEYADGACKFGFSSSPRVNLQSEIPSGYTCTTGPSGTSTFVCTSPDSRGQQCSPGQFLQYTSDGNRSYCSACSGNTFSNGTRVGQCPACPSGSVADAAHNACNACTGNQYSQGSSCVTCPLGDSTNAQHTGCVCTGNQISQGSSCVACPSGATATAGNTVCTCTPPQVLQNGSCALCPSGSVANAGFTSCVSLASLSCVVPNTGIGVCTGVGSANPCNSINPNVNWVYAKTDTTTNCLGWVACCPNGYKATGWSPGCPSTPPTVSCTPSH